MVIPEGSLILVDLDLTLTLDVSWTVEEALHAKPNKEMIAWVNEQYRKKNVIIIYSARTQELMEASKYWLKTNGVHYHSIRFNKIPAFILVDDRTITPDQLLKEWKEERGETK